MKMNKLLMNKIDKIPLISNVSLIMGLLLNESHESNFLLLFCSFRASLSFFDKVIILIIKTSN